MRSRLPWFDTVAVAARSPAGELIERRASRLAIRRTANARKVVPLGNGTSAVSSRNPSPTQAVTRSRAPGTCTTPSR
jgi:hypothetical protein